MMFARTCPNRRFRERSNCSRYISTTGSQRAFNHVEPKPERVKPHQTRSAAALILPLRCINIRISRGQDMSSPIMSEDSKDSPDASYSYTEGEITNAKGHRLFTVAYRPKDAPKAVWLFHHGYGEHIGRYTYAFTQLAQSGIAIHSFDCQSMGKSEPEERVLIWDIQHLADDLLLMHESVRKEYGADMPVFIGGQSMGGLVALLTVLRDQSRFRGVVLCSPAVDIKWTWIYRLQLMVGQLLVWALPTARLVPSLPMEGVSQDPDVVRAAVSDPLNVPGPIRAVTGWQIVQGTFHLHRHMNEIHLPIFASHGTMDRLTSLDGVKNLFKAAKSTDTTLYEVEGGYHELLLGPEKQEVVESIKDWMLSRSAPEKPT